MHWLVLAHDKWHIETIQLCGDKCEHEFQHAYIITAMLKSGNYSIAELIKKYRSNLNLILDSTATVLLIADGQDIAILLLAQYCFVF